MLQTMSFSHSPSAVRCSVQEKPQPRSLSLSPFAVCKKCRNPGVSSLSHTRHMHARTHAHEFRTTDPDYYAHVSHPLAFLHQASMVDYTVTPHVHTHSLPLSLTPSVNERLRLHHIRAHSLTHPHTHHTLMADLNYNTHSLSFFFNRYQWLTMTTVSSFSRTSLSLSLSLSLWPSLSFPASLSLSLSLSLWCSTGING